MDIFNREDWLTQLGDAFMIDLIDPAVKQLGLHLKQPPVRYSIGGVPGVRKQASITGCCYARSRSKDGHNEIFISPACEDDFKIAHTLLHELIHAYLDLEDGHKGRFAALCKQIGLEPPLLSTTPNWELSETIKMYLDALGKCPTAPLKIDDDAQPDAPKGGKPDTTKPKKQTTRNVKFYCVECDFKANTSRTQLARLSESSPCPCCGGEGTLTWENKDQ